MSGARRVARPRVRQMICQMPRQIGAPQKRAKPGRPRGGAGPGRGGTIDAIFGMVYINNSTVVCGHEKITATHAARSKHFPDRCRLYRTRSARPGRCPLPSRRAALYASRPACAPAAG